MRVCENGKYRDMTPKEIEEINTLSEKPNYKESVVVAIRERYSIDDEIAILRQRESKPEEFNEYYNFVESVKAAAKAAGTR